MRKQIWTGALVLVLLLQAGMLNVRAEETESSTLPILTYQGSGEEPVSSIQETGDEYECTTLSAETAVSISRDSEQRIRICQSGSWHISCRIQLRIRWEEPPVIPLQQRRGERPI